MHTYLDNSATTPMLTAVLEAMSPYWQTKFANPSSPHHLGVVVESTLNQCRQILAQLLDVKAEEIYFTAGGTEANNLALQGLARAYGRAGHMITSPTEHDSVLQVAHFLEQDLGWDITYLSVDRLGRVNLEELRNAITPRTKIISIMMVNNEIGTIQPIAEIGSIIKEVNQVRQDKIVFHVDAIQSLGRLPFTIHALNIDMLSISGHKIFGPKGSALLFVRRGIQISPVIFGGGQERTLRSGTENIPAIVGLTKACQIVLQSQHKNIIELTQKRDSLLEGLAEIPGITFNSHRTGAPHIVNLQFAGLRGEVLVHFLEQRGVFVSMGAACTARKQSISHVLQAVGLTPEEASSSLRISLSSITTMEEIAYAIKVMQTTVTELRAIYH